MFRSDFFLFLLVQVTIGASENYVQVTGTFKTKQNIHNFEAYEIFERFN